MSGYELLIGPWNISSHSLAAWLALQAAGMEFATRRLDTGDPDVARQIEELSPGGRLPVLRRDGVPVAWELWGILELAAEQAAALWPQDPADRARARSIAAEALGCTELQTFLPMDFTGRFEGPPRLPRTAERQARRLIAIWQECLARPEREGPFLFGPFGLVDAVMVPFAARFRTHGLPLDADAQAYADMLLSLDAVLYWEERARSEREGTEPEETSVTPGFAGAGPTTRPTAPPPEPAAAAEAPTPTPAASPAAPVARQGTGRRLFAGHSAPTAPAEPARERGEPPSPPTEEPPPRPREEPAAISTPEPGAPPASPREAAPAPAPAASATGAPVRRPLFGRGGLFRRNRAGTAGPDPAAADVTPEQELAPPRTPGALRPETLRPADPTGTRQPERGPAVKPIGIAARRRR